MTINVALLFLDKLQAICYLLETCISLKILNVSMVGFIYLLVFPFVYQFNSRIGVLDHHLQMTSSEGFQQHFSNISKFVCCGFYMKKNVAFTLISFTVLK